MFCLLAFGGSIFSTPNFKRHERERRAELGVSGQVRIVGGADKSLVCFRLRLHNLRTRFYKFAISLIN